MSDFVLDNSVTMRSCFDSGAHVYADQVLDRLEARRSVAFVPILWRYEVSAVLARAQIKAMFPAQRVADFLRSLAALDIRIDDDSAGRRRLSRVGTASELAAGN